MLCTHLALLQTEIMVIVVITIKSTGKSNMQLSVCAYLEIFKPKGQLLLSSVHLKGYKTAGVSSIVASGRQHPVHNATCF